MPAALRSLLLSVGLVTALHATEPTLAIIAPEHTVTLTTAEFAALPRTECTVTDPHGGTSLRYSGVAVRDLLARVEAPSGAALRGQALSLAVVVGARDGYKVVFTLADFDAAFSDRVILLADHKDGAALADTAGPYQLIVPGDKRPARWVRMVTSIELVRVGPPAAPRAKH